METLGPPNNHLMPFSMNNQKPYVVGFLFSADGDMVALIHKKTPAWQNGMLNGIGGKVEPGETAIEAMRREAVEEAGAAMADIDWEFVGTYQGEGAHVSIFRAFDDAVFRAETMEEEVVSRYVVNDILIQNTVPNLRWAIPLFQDRTSKIHFPIDFYFDWRTFKHT